MDQSKKKTIKRMAHEFASTGQNIDPNLLRPSQADSERELEEEIQEITSSLAWDCCAPGCDGWPHQKRGDDRKATKKILDLIQNAKREAYLRGKRHAIDYLSSVPKDSLYGTLQEEEAKVDKALKEHHE